MGEREGVELLLMQGVTDAKKSAMLVQFWPKGKLLKAQTQEKPIKSNSKSTAKALLSFTLGPVKSVMDST